MELQTENSVHSSAFDEPMRGLSIAFCWNLIKRYRIPELFLLFGISLTFFQFLSVTSGRNQQNDFAHYYVSSRYFLDGRDDVYQVNFRDDYQKLGWFILDQPIFQATNPPALIQFFSLYAQFSPDVAYRGWMMTQFVCLLIIIAICFLLVKGKLSWSGFAITIGAFLLLPATVDHFKYSQVQLFLAALIMIAFWLQTRKQSELACLFIIFATLLKLFPIVLLPWFIMRSSGSLKRRITLGFLVTLTLIVGVWMTDIQMWLEFSAHARREISLWAKIGRSYTIASLLAKVAMVAANDLRSPLIGYFFRMGVVISATILLVTYARLLKKKRDPYIEFALLIMMMMICGATCWLHYQVFMVFPFVVAATLLKDRLNLCTIVSVPFVVGLLKVFPGRFGIPSFGLLFTMYVPFYAMIIIALYLAFELSEEKKTGLVTETTS